MTSLPSAWPNAPTRPTVARRICPRRNLSVRDARACLILPVRSRWKSAAEILSIMLAGFSGLGVGIWLTCGQLVDLSARTAVRIVEVGQPVVDGAVAP